VRDAGVSFMTFSYSIEHIVKESKEDFLKKIVEDFESSSYPDLTEIYSPLPFFINELIEGLIHPVSDNFPHLYYFIQTKKNHRDNISFKKALKGLKIIRNVFLEICLKNVPEKDMNKFYMNIISFFDEIEEMFMIDLEDYFKYANNDTLRDRIIKAHKLAIIGKLTSYVAHEFNNILTVTKNWAQLGLIEKDEAVRNKAFSGIVSSSERGSRLTKSILNFSRRAEFEPCQININEFIDEILVIIEKKLIKDGIDLKKSYGNVPEITVDKFKLREALFNILINACASLTGSVKKIIVATSVKEDRIEITFSDTGEGIGFEYKDKIYEPFFTTKLLNKDEIDWSTGIGMGVTIAYDIIKDHGGEISVKSEEGRGTDFTVYLPVNKQGE
jgi:signal transduction histidine kinase